MQLLNSNINNKKWKYISSGFNVTLPKNISEYDEVMFSIECNGYPQGSIIFPTIHSYICDANITGVCHISGYYIGDNNFGMFAINKTGIDTFHAEAGWYVCNINGTWLDGTIHLYVR